MSHEEWSEKKEDLQFEERNAFFFLRHIVQKYLDCHGAATVRPMYRDLLKKAVKASKDASANLSAHYQIPSSPTQSSPREDKGVDNENVCDLRRGSSGG